MAVYDLGTPVALGVTVRDANGIPANATSVVATIEQPDGTFITPAVTNPDDGLYQVTLTPSQSGRFVIRWLAQGVNASSYMDEFKVRSSALVAPFSFQDAKDYLNLKHTVDEDELRRFIDTASAKMERYLRRIIGRRTFTDTFSGGQMEHFFLNATVISIGSVKESGVTLDPTSYVLDSMGFSIRRTDGQVFERGLFNIEITYVAGYADPPADVVHGTLDLLRHLWDTQRGPTSVLASSTSDDYDSRSTYSLPRRVRELVDDYRLSITA